MSIQIWQYYPNGVPQVSNLCASFWWRDIMKLVDKYREFCSVKIGAGDTALFWFDSWHGSLLHSQFPRLFSFAMDQNIYVRDFIDTANRTQFFQLPMSPQAFYEFQELKLSLQNVHCDPMVRDVWSTIWRDGAYSSRLYSQHCFKDVVASKIYSAIWSCKVMLRIKVFAWLLVSDRLNTRDMMRRRHWKVTNNQFHCVLCPQRTGCTCFLTVTLVFEFGAIFRSIGNLVILLKRFSLQLRGNSRNRSLLRWLS
jgi:hypothetical protein